MRGVAEHRKREIGNANIWHWKIVDTDLTPSKDDPEDNGGRTIAVAVWKMMNVENDRVDGHSYNSEQEGGSPGTVREEALNEHASVPAETEAPANNSLGPRSPSFLPPEIRLDALKSLFNPLDASRNGIMGTEKPFFMLNSLATHPDHQGRGAGKMLLDWGVKKADDEQLVTYLDATQVAKPIYEKRGFEVKRAVEWDRTVWGGEGLDIHYSMVRRPRTGHGQ
ncbi:hypothetical protein E8E12_003197 [Didymella heteroderae]|uniref:N-acetyltransferase domain-containing protein n=1 Tax=Didymella heteroderae TaxID=1769908 RepID=A0A9P4WSQ0_9PLEO|nr:hypothetical protein E8E12_003197 [Didymella heteroderae]